ncbi:MAG: PAS domain-containing sensor histidine kinase [Thermodesulfobacteriota bacterium]
MRNAPVPELSGLSEKLLGRLSCLITYNPNTIIITDKAGRIEYVNEVFTSTTGYLPAEVMGHHVESIGLHDLDSLRSLSWHAICRGEIWEGEITSYKKNGALFYEQTFVLPLTDDDDVVCWICFIKRDISERKRYERSLLDLTKALENQIREQKATEIELKVVNRQNELILNSVAEGIFGVDVEGTITFINAAAEQLTGYRSDELFGRHYHLLFRQNTDSGSQQAPSLSPVFAAFHDGRFHRSNHEIFIRQDGSDFPVHLACAPIIEDRTVIGAVVLFKDITEELRIQRQKEQAEQELRELTATLDQRVQQRTAQLNAANASLINTLDLLQRTQNQLVQSEKMASLGQLVAGIAHEINTPVGIAYTASTHLEKESKQLAERYRAGEMTRSHLEEYLQVCLESTVLLQSNLTRAGELIRSFKQVAIDQSGEGRRSFNLREYVNEVLLSLRPLLKKTRHTISLECSDDIVLRSYPGAFSQILTNLITNSITHAFAEGEAGILRMMFTINDTSLVFIYSDNGKGIAAADLPHIFEPFFTTSRNRGGSGLGLHIIYNIITQKLNGNVTCHSAPGEGTTFTIQLPAH